MSNIAKLHQEVFDFLEEKREKYPDLYFSLRTDNVKNRLTDGHRFWGNDKNLYFSFWEGQDRIAKAANISIHITIKGHLYLWLNAKDNDKKAVFFEKLAHTLGRFSRTKNTQTNEYENTWRRSYAQEGWKSGLEDFIENDWKKINQFLLFSDLDKEITPIHRENFEESIRIQDEIKQKDVLTFRIATLPRKTYKPIKLRELYLQNIGHFEELSLSLSQKVTILIGENGSGKSTVLRALALALTGVNAFQESGQNLLGKELKDWLQIIGYDNKRPVYAQNGLINLLYERNDEHNNEIKLYFNDRLGVLAEDVLEPETEYFATMHNESETDILFLGFPQGGGYESPAKLHESNRPEYIDLFTMITDRAHKKLERFKNWTDTNYKQHLTALKDGNLSEATAYLSKIKDVFKLISLVTSENESETIVEFSKILYDEEAKDGRIILVNIKSANLDKPQTIELDLLSQGYQNLFYWFGELVSRAHQVNEFYKKEQPQKAKESIFEMNGIVLIDEIDTYLHLKWQQNILKVLADKFKNMQFVVTTHSSKVLTGISSDICNAFKIEDKRAERLEYFYGQEINKANKVFFDVPKRDKYIQEKVDTIISLLDEETPESIEKAEKLYLELAAILGHEDTDMVFIDTTLSILKIEQGL
ncbi:AAA family ATPase [Hugenholtzia roseola]|uniref:AAA family ATPase n=1 Tax=Hugenholtzia roseola TaxID=1002 RepID=UPI00041AD1B6|nr:AAA family ATPase [Hugenholtzia roseola]